MAFPEASHILAECSEEVLSKLSFFRIREGKPIPTFLEGSQLFQDNDHIDQLLKFNLIHEEPPAPSFIFYRERVEDFVFVKCDTEIKACNRKIHELESLAARDGGQDGELTRRITTLTNQLAHLEDIKQAFSFLYINSATIPSNERYADADERAKKAALDILGSWYSKERGSIPCDDQNPIVKYFQFLKQRGFWKEYNPARCFIITKLGIDVLELLRNKEQNILSPEEVEFDKIVKDMNRLDILKRNKK